MQSKNWTARDHDLNADRRSVSRRNRVLWERQAYGEHIQDRSAQLLGVERFDQRGFVRHPATRQLMSTASSFIFDSSSEPIMARVLNTSIRNSLEWSPSFRVELCFNSFP